MRSVIIVSGSVLLLALVLAGCGGGSSNKIVSNPNQVASVTVSPNSVSLNAGDVAQINALAVNSGGTPVTGTFTYSSSNFALITISPTGLVCGGVWDSAFVICKGTDSSGNPLAGQATLTATSQGVISSAIPVSVHPKITSLLVDPVAGCTSTTQTQQFFAHACSTFALPHDAAGPCAPNAKEITTLVGPFQWNATNSQVASLDANGLVTGHNPGTAGIFVTNTNVSSPVANYRTCMPIEIRLHVPGDLPGHLTTSANLALSGTQTVEADYTDEKGFALGSAPVTILSNDTAVATISGTTVTAQSFGGAGIIAVCLPPGCGIGLNAPVYSNLFQITVTGTSPTTTVFATSSFTPPSGTSPTIIPIDTSKSPPVAGTAINLPGTPNSFVVSANGSSAYLGTTAGLVKLDTAGQTVTLVAANILGTVLAVSNDGTSAIVSNLSVQPDPTQQHFSVFNSAGVFQDFIAPGAVAAAYDADGFRAYVVANNGNVYVVSPANPPQLSLQTTNIGGSSTSIASLASDPYVYVANSGVLDVIATCNNAQQPTANNPPTTSAVQLVAPMANADMVVAVNATGIDIETVTVTSILSTNPPLPFNFSPGNCQPPVAYSDQFIDFGLGAFTAHQLLTPTSGTGGTNGSHIVVLPAGINKVLVAVPGSSGALIPLAGAATEALSGGMTPDGNTAWVGVGGTNTVDKITLTNNTDAAQVAMPFKKSDGTPAPPDLVVVTPK